MSLGKGLVEISGPLMRAWVRIPLLTTNLLGILMKKMNLFIPNSFEFLICWFNVSSTSRFFYKVFFKTCDCLILLKCPMLIPFLFFFASFLLFLICMTSFLGVVLEKLVGKHSYPASVAQ